MVLPGAAGEDGGVLQHLKGVFIAYVSICQQMSAYVVVLPGAADEDGEVQEHLRYVDMHLKACGHFA